MRLNERSLAGAPLPAVCIYEALPISREALVDLLNAHGMVTQIDIYHDPIGVDSIVACWDNEGYVEYCKTNSQDWDWAILQRRTYRPRQIDFDFDNRFVPVFEISWVAEGF